MRRQAVASDAAGIVWGIVSRGCRKERMGLAPAGHGEVFLGATSPLGEILPKRFTQSFCIPQAGHRLTARLSAIAVYRDVPSLPAQRSEHSTLKRRFEKK